MKRIAALLLLSVLTVFSAGCGREPYPDYAGTVDTGAVILPDSDDYLRDSAEGPAPRPAVRFTVTRLSASGQTGEEDNGEDPTEAYRRLLSASATADEPSDRDLYIYRYMYALNEEAADAGTDPEAYCETVYGMSLGEYRDKLIRDLTELLVVTAFCESRGVVYTKADRAALLNGEEVRYPADEYGLQLAFYRSEALRILGEQADTSLPRDARTAVTMLMPEPLPAE